MASFGETFTTADMPESENKFKSLPTDWYRVEIVSGEVKDNPQTGNRAINLGMKITGEDYNNRRLFARFNIRNRNPVATKIGLEQWGDLMRAVGVLKASDTDELLGRELEVKVIMVDEPNPQYADEDGKKNEIKGYRALNRRPNAPAAPAQTAKPAQAAPSSFDDEPVQSAKVAPPWATKK